jgi:hypothetical protein
VRNLPFNRSQQTSNNTNQSQAVKNVQEAKDLIDQIADAWEVLEQGAVDSYERITKEVKQIAEDVSRSYDVRLRQLMELINGSLCGEDDPTDKKDPKNGKKDPNPLRNTGKTPPKTRSPFSPLPNPTIAL